MSTSRHARYAVGGVATCSTGIIFVSILKICYVRPYRRQLIIESESRAEAEAA